MIIRFNLRPTFKEHYMQHRCTVLYLVQGLRGDAWHKEESIPVSCSALPSVLGIIQCISVICSIPLKGYSHHFRWAGHREARLSPFNPMGVPNKAKHTRWAAIEENGESHGSANTSPSSAAASSEVKWWEYPYKWIGFAWSVLLNNFLHCWIRITDYFIFLVVLLIMA